LILPKFHNHVFYINFGLGPSKYLVTNLFFSRMGNFKCDVFALYRASGKQNIVIDSYQ